LGKGSTRRPGDMDAYRAGWDRLFRALADLDSAKADDVYFEEDFFFGGPRQKPTTQENDDDDRTDD
jgi:hypothetical protein